MIVPPTCQRRRVSAALHVLDFCEKPSNARKLAAQPVQRLSVVLWHAVSTLLARADEVIE
jgi:hypothetical protein